MFLFVSEFIKDLLLKLQAANPKLYGAIIFILYIAVMILVFLPQITGTVMPAIVDTTVSSIIALLTALGFMIGFPVEEITKKEVVKKEVILPEPKEYEPELLPVTKSKINPVG